MFMSINNSIKRWITRYEYLYNIKNNLNKI